MANARRSYGPESNLVGDMSFKDDIKHGAESVKGKAKEAFR